MPSIARKSSICAAARREISRHRAAIYRALGKSTRVEDKRMFASLSFRARVNVSRTAIGVQVRLAYTPTHTRLPRALQYRGK